MYNIFTRTIIRQKLRGHLPKYFPQVQVAQQNSVSVEKKNDKSNKVSNIKKYWHTKIFSYLEKYENALEKKFPKTMKLYRVFSIGTKEFIKDFYKYTTLVRKYTKNGPGSLSLEEMNLIYQMPKDIARMTPVLIISAIPFTNYIILPLAFYYPRLLLSSHYWTFEQKLEFMLLDQKRRLKHNRPLFRCVQAELDSIKDASLKMKWSDVTAALGSGTHPKTEDILLCIDLFKGPPYSLQHLKHKHLIHLTGIHDLSLWRPFKRKALLKRCFILKQMDFAIKEEGGPNKMSSEAVRKAVSLRGVNPTNMSMESMQDYLNKWITISDKVDRTTASLLLHAPILLAYNHPNNWLLIY
ncbi:LETM1 domain-containing protein 1 [Prorops nasuta]|uniref:LETM1 domain-containing protein 1 n=1 Tax=Prorops nasuta TaxID=863751 RepID=UPI0034CF1693